MQTNRRFDTFSVMRHSAARVLAPAGRWGLGAVLTGMAMTSFGAIPQMTAHFPLDETSGTEVSDAVGGLKGELRNTDGSEAWIDGAIGGALHLDGEDDHVAVASEPAVDFDTEAFSVSLWIRWPQENVPGHQHFINKGDYNSSKEGETGKRWELTTFPNKGVTFIVDDDVNKSAIIVPFDAFATGEWVHVAAIRDTTNKVLRLYADGVRQESIDMNDPTTDGVDRTQGTISNTCELHIGYSGYNDNPFKGDLDDIRLFRTSLSEDQIGELMALRGPAEDHSPESAHDNAQ